MIEPVWEVGKDTAIGPRGLRFDNRACQIGRSVANGSPPLRHFFEAMFSRR